MKAQSQQRLQMCGANLLMDLAKKVFGEAGSSTHKLQQLAAGADDKQLAVIPHKYWKAVRSLSKVHKTLFYLSFTMLTLS